VREAGGVGVLCLGVRPRGGSGANVRGTELELEWRRDRLVVRVEGALCALQADGVADELRVAICRAPRRPREVVVDLGGCPVVDTLGLRALAEAADQIPVVLVGTGPFVGYQVAVLKLPAGIRVATRGEVLPRRRPARKDRRRHRRVPIEGEATLRWAASGNGGAQTVRRPLHDLSEGGLGVSAPGVGDAWPGSDRVRALEVFAPRLFGTGWIACRPINGTTRPGTLGLEFQHLPPAVSRRVHTLIAGAVSSC